MGELYSEYPDEDTGLYQTGGGNMRWHAMKHVLHIPDDHEIWVSLNFPTNEAERIELSLMDNQKFGTYEKQKLAELTFPHIEEINLETYKISIDEPVSLKNVLKGFGSVGDDEQDPPEETYYTCDNCGYKIPLVDIKSKGQK